MATGPGSADRLAQKEVARLKNSAVEVARQLAEAYPRDALTSVLLGSAYYNIGQAEPAAAYLNKCLQLDPNRAEAYGILARIAYEKGQLDETVRLCQEALKHGPPTPEVLNQMGHALMDGGKTQEAIQTLQQAVHLPDAVSESSYLLGQAQLQAGDYARAKQSFQEAIKLLPDHTQAYFGLFTACLRLGRADEAARYQQRFQQLEAIDRRSLSDRSTQEDTLTGLPIVRATVARTIFGAGQIYGAHQQGAKAAELMQKAAALDAENPMYRAALEAYYLQSGAPADGVAAFQQLIREQPDSFWNYLFLGRLQARLEQFDAAARSYRKVQELAPQRREGYRALAEIYLRTGRNLPEAQKLAERVAALEPTGPNYYFLSYACAKNENRSGALDAAKHAVQLSPGEKKFQDLLQQLRQLPSK